MAQCSALWRTRTSHLERDGCDNALVAENVTATDAARLWLKTSYVLPLRRRRDQFAPSPVPLLARPGRYADCAYVDIKSTYRAIVNAFGYDVEYRRGAYLSPELARPPLPELIATNKRAYASIVSLSASYQSTMQQVVDGKVRTFRVRNVYYQPCLWSLTRDILLGVYSQMFLTCTLLYANTDGYIVRKHELADAEAVIHEWGFKSSIKAVGSAEVYGVGAYRIGNIVSQRVLTTPQRIATAPMAPHAYRWLRTRVAKLIRHFGYMT